MKYLLLILFLPLAWAESPWFVSHELEPGGRVLAQSADGRYIALDSVLAPLTVWDLQEARIIALFEGHELEPRPRDYDFPWPSYAVDRAIFTGDWLVSILSSSGLEVQTGLIAHNLQTGERLELASGSCDAITSTAEGFVASCEQRLSFWQQDEDGFNEVSQLDYWLHELLFDPEKSELLGLNLDPLAKSGIVALSYPELTPIRFLAGHYVRLLGFNENHHLLAVSWTDDGIRLEILGEVETLNSLILPEVFIPSLMLSPDRSALLLELNPMGGDHRILRLADGALLDNPADLRFTFNLEQYWHPKGILSWSQAATYYHDLLRLWQPEETSDILFNPIDYQFIYMYEEDWQVLNPHEFYTFTAPLFDTDPSSLARRAVSRFQESDEAGRPEISTETVAESRMLATATVPVLDDSVRAYRYQFGLHRLEFAYGAVWAVWEVRHQWQCARGERMGEWTTEYCP